MTNKQPTLLNKENIPKEIQTEIQSRKRKYRRKRSRRKRV